MVTASLFAYRLPHLHKNRIPYNQVFYNENFLDQMLQLDVRLDYEKPATPHQSEPKLKDVCSFQQIHISI